MSRQKTQGLSRSTVQRQNIAPSATRGIHRLDGMRAHAESTLRPAPKGPRLVDPEFTPGLRSSQFPAPRTGCGWRGSASPRALAGDTIGVAIASRIFVRVRYRCRPRFVSRGPARFGFLLATRAPFGAPSVFRAVFSGLKPGATYHGPFGAGRDRRTDGRISSDIAFVANAAPKGPWWVAPDMDPGGPSRQYRAPRTGCGCRVIAPTAKVSETLGVAIGFVQPSRSPAWRT